MLIAGENDLRAYEPAPPAIFTPLGPEGGTGQMPGAEAIGPTHERQQAPTTAA